MKIRLTAIFCSILFANLRSKLAFQKRVFTTFFELFTVPKHSMGFPGDIVKTGSESQRLWTLLYSTPVLVDN